MIDLINWLTLPILGLFVGFGVIFSASILFLLLYAKRHFKD